MSSKFQFRRVRMPNRVQCKYGAPVEIPEDVNSDGSANIGDLMFVADHLDQAGEGNAADVNGDGVVNVLDLVAIAKAMERNPSPQIE